MSKKTLLQLFLGFFASLILFLMAAFPASAASEEEQPPLAPVTNPPGRYKLYPTKNMWIFLKLDTRTGAVWMVQYSVSEDQPRMITEVDTNPCIESDEKEARNGRFELYPTKNMYNFLLLDLDDGRVWQVQWAKERENRGSIRIWNESEI